jgi:hypothetical protein
MSRAGTMGNGAIGFERTYESKQRRAEIAVIGNPPEGAVAKFWREAHERDKAREKQWEQEERERRTAIAANAKAIEDHTSRVIATRTFDLMLTNLFDGASDDVRRRVKLIVERNYSPDKQRDIEVWTYVFNKLQAEMGGHAEMNCPDWRGGLQK